MRWLLYPGEIVLVLEEQLRFLVKSNFKVEDIVGAPGVLSRDGREYGIRSSDFSTLSDNELDDPSW